MLMLEEKRTEIVKRVWDLAESLVESEDMELIEVEYQREGRGWILRLYLDSEQGVTIADCTRISRQLGDLLDVEDFIPNTYTLEVSSPGFNRPLRRIRDFQRYLGHEVKVRVKEPYEGRRNFHGELRDISEEGITIFCKDGNVYVIPYDNIHRANLVPRFD